MPWIALDRQLEMRSMERGIWPIASSTMNENFLSHAGTVVPECFKDDNASQWMSGKFDPHSLKNPRTDRHLNLHGWLRRGPLPPCKISWRYDYPLSPPNTRKFASSDSASFFGSSVSLQPRPLHRFSRSIRQMTSFRARMCLLGVPKTKFYILTPFSPKNANFWPMFDGNFASKRPLQWRCSRVKYP